MGGGADYRVLGVRPMSQDREHDNHCLLVFEGVVWRIGQIMNDGQSMGLWHGPGARDQEFVVIDISGVDWSSYCTVASRMLDDENFPGEESVRNFGNRRHSGIVLEIDPND
jgi:hypothetical protein